MNKELVEKIRRSFDLNLYETKVWLALLAKGAASIAEVHELSKVPRSRIYDVLKSLETKGFCVEKLGKPIKYMAVEPSVVIEKLKKNIEGEAKERVEMLSKVPGSDEYKQLEVLFNSTFNMTEKVGTAIRGRSNLISHLSNVTKNANDKIIIVSTPRGLERKLNALLPILTAKVKKGVSVTVGVANGDGKETVSEELQNRLKELNIKVKQLQGGARFCVIDNNILLITSTEETRDDNALWLQSDFFAETLAALVRK